MKATATDPRITIRLPVELLAQLRECHARTYPQHRTSWNTWLVIQLEAAATTILKYHLPRSADQLQSSGPSGQ
jgi:hypothetical protein